MAACVGAKVRKGDAAAQQEARPLNRWQKEAFGTS